MSSSVTTNSPERFARHEKSTGHLVSQLISENKKVSGKI